MNHYGIMSIKVARTFLRLLFKLGIQEVDNDLLFSKNLVNNLDKELTHQSINARAIRMASTTAFLRLIEKLNPPPKHDPEFYRFSTHGFVTRMEVLDPEGTAAAARLFGVGIVKHKTLPLETVGEVQDKTTEEKGAFLVNYYNGSITFKDFVALADLTKAKFVTKT